MQAKLNALPECFNFPNVILMRALRRNVLPKDAREEFNEIPFPTIMLECKVRLHSQGCSSLQP